jgi:hypothetical protein
MRVVPPPGLLICLGVVFIAVGAGALLMLSNSASRFIWMRVNAFVAVLLGAAVIIFGVVRAIS